MLLKKEKKIQDLDLPDTRFNTNTSIQITDLIKIYKRGKVEVVALRGLTCEFRTGEISVVMGPSGCGKTTMLNLIGGLDRPASGKIIVNGENIFDLSDKELENYRRTRIGYVFQLMNLMSVLNVYENIELPMLLTNISSEVRKKRIKDLLTAIGLTNRANHKPDELSGGEQQKVAIAIALANDPDILLCDEPTGELDSDSKLMIMDVLKNIILKYPEKIIIIVTHDGDMRRIADHLLYIRDGKISHELQKDAIKKEFDKISDIEDKTDSNEKSLKELRELRHILDGRIGQLENKRDN